MLRHCRFWRSLVVRRPVLSLLLCKGVAWASWATDFQSPEPRRIEKHPPMHGLARKIDGHRSHGNKTANFGMSDHHQLVEPRRGRQLPQDMIECEDSALFQRVGHAQSLVLPKASQARHLSLACDSNASPPLLLQRRRKIHLLHDVDCHEPTLRGVLWCERWLLFLSSSPT